jgi:hypothetical protein
MAARSNRRLKRILLRLQMLSRHHLLSQERVYRLSSLRRGYQLILNEADAVIQLAHLFFQHSNCSQNCNCQSPQVPHKTSRSQGPKTANFRRNTERTASTPTQAGRAYLLALPACLTRLLLTQRALHIQDRFTLRAHYAKQVLAAPQRDLGLDHQLRA